MLSVKTGTDISVEKADHSSPQFADFDSIQPGCETSFSKTITAEDLESFARLSGDRNPLHMNDEFAARTHFQRRVVHGMLLASYVSAMVGMRCPGPGALWAQQSFRWQAPAFIGDRIVITLKVKHKSTGSRTLTLEVKTVNQDGKMLMEGEGTVAALEENRRSEDVPVSGRFAFVNGGSREIGAAISYRMSQISPVAQNRALSRVLALAANVFEVQESGLAAGSSPDTIESWDSLHHLTFVVALEQEFNIQFSPEEIEQLLSIELAAALVEEKAKGQEISDGY